VAKGHQVGHEVGAECQGGAEPDGDEATGGGGERSAWRERSGEAECKDREDVVEATASSSWT